MLRAISLLTFAAAALCCANPTDTSRDDRTDRTDRTDQGERPSPAHEGAADGSSSQVDAAPVVDDTTAAPSPEADPDGDGAVSVDEPALPASAGQSCLEWTDCGPHFANTNSGFDCTNSTCTCDDTGQWAVACAGIDGYWSPEECFCFVGTTPPPNEAAVLPLSVSQGGDNAEDVVCWWRWKDLGCDADRWVDRSYYERVCDSQGCWNEYVEDGYYEDGDCRGRWIKRCSDGYEYW